MAKTFFIGFLAMTLWLSSMSFAVAHHVLGRPSDSLNADSNTPPGMHVETQIGDYLVTYMAFPAFPQPGKRGRINLYATRIDNGTPFPGEIAFKLRHDPWYSCMRRYHADDGRSPGGPDASSGKRHAAFLQR